MRILLADDHAIVRDGIRLLLERLEPGFTIVGEVDDGLAAVRACAALRPDVVLIDVRMPLLDGVGATRTMLAGSPAPRVVALSGADSQEDVRDMLAAGATGYVLKSDLTHDLVIAIRTVATGGTYLSPRVARRGSSLVAGTGTALERLTAREREVLRHVAEGGSTKEIAARLGVSVKTVETQRKQLMTKLDIHSIAGLARYAVRAGLVEP